MRKYIPAILEEAPFERPVVREIVTLLDEGASVQVEHTNDKWKKPPYMSYTVLRATFDNWLSEKVMEKGGFVIPKRKVDGLLFEDGRVAGVKIGDEEIPANIVIAADGALSFMAEKAGLRKDLEPADYAVRSKRYTSSSPAGSRSVSASKRARARPAFTRGRLPKACSAGDFSTRTGRASPPASS